MSTTSDITEHQLVEAIHRVPRERWPEVLEFLRTRQSDDKQVSPIRTGTDLAQSDLVGIWADRTDISSTREFADSLRQQAERRGVNKDVAGH